MTDRPIFLQKLAERGVVHAAVSRARCSHQIYYTSLLVMAPSSVRLDTSHHEEGEVQDKHDRSQGYQGLHYTQVLISGTL